MGLGEILLGLGGLGGFLTGLVALLRYRSLKSVTVELKDNRSYLALARTSVDDLLNAQRDYQSRMEELVNKLEDALRRERNDRASAESRVVLLTGEIASLKVEQASLADNLAMLRARYETMSRPLDD